MSPIVAGMAVGEVGKIGDKFKSGDVDSLWNFLIIPTFGNPFASSLALIAAASFAKRAAALAPSAPTNFLDTEDDEDVEAVVAVAIGDSETSVSSDGEVAGIDEDDEAFDPLLS